ncbi:MAG: sodium:solute symporter family protein, partial [Calditrichota bacterium]
SGWKAGLSMAATQFAADTPLLVMGLIAAGGIFLVWQLWVYGIAFLMMAFIFSALWRRSRVLTDAELTEVRYSGRAALGLRVLKALYYGTLINCVVMAFVLVAAVRIAEIFLPWHLWLPAGLYGVLMSILTGVGIDLSGSISGLDPAIATTNNLLSILLILGFTTLYSATGGLRSVIATDVMQFGLAMVGTLIYAVIVVANSGGLGGLTSRVAETYGSELSGKMLSFAPSGGDVLLPFFMLMGLQWFFQMNSDGTGYLAQRSMACTTDKDARVAGVIFSWMQIVARSLIWLVIGVGLLVIYPFTAESMAGDGFKAGREILFVTGINDLLPVGVRGLMLTGLLAALASTLDTHLNWGASYWSNDIYDRLISQEWRDRTPSSSELVWAARLSNLLILTIALIIMSQLGSIQQGWKISLLFGAGMGSVLVLRWLWERITLYSELAAMAVSMLMGILLLYLYPSDDQEWIRLGLMAVFSTGAAILITFVTPATDPEVLKSFYKKVKPLGFWRKTAAAVGDDPNAPVRELAESVKLTVFASLSLFLMLIGLGKLLIRLPDDTVLLPLGLILASLAIIPLWWKGVAEE